MGVWQQVSTWRDRRLRLPVDGDALVLDVGGGDHPHWRSDVVVDRFPDATDAAQRFGGGASRDDRPLFVADAANLPFVDGAFDYVVCSHTLEHVLDPAGAIREMCRVAPAGYIEVPDAGSSKILDFPTHLWWCTLEDGTLVFRAKSEWHHDADIARFVSHPRVERDVAALQHRHFGETICALHWEGEVSVRVEGTLNPGLAAVGDSDLAKIGFPARVARSLLAAAGGRAFQRRRRRRPITYGEILEGDSYGEPSTLMRCGIHRLPVGGQP